MSVRSDQAFDHVKQSRIIDQHTEDRVLQMRCANLVDLKVFVTIRSRLNILKSLILLQTVDRFHVTDSKAIHLGRVEEAVRKDKAILKKASICSWSSLNGLPWGFGSRFQKTKNKQQVFRAQPATRGQDPIPHLIR